MTRGAGLEDSESPFLLEALQPAASAPDLIGQLSKVARRLSRTGRRHVERALVRHLADSGESDPRALAGAVSSLRQTLADSSGAETEALEVVAEELSSGEAEDGYEAGQEHEGLDMEAGQDEQPGFVYETPMEPAAAADSQSAEPAFSGALRKRLGPVLDAGALAKAVAFNAAQHPTVSEIPLVDLYARLELYVERDSLVAAMGAGTPTEADVTAQMAQQFQRKCFRETRFHTGRLDEPTLDALGFVRHRGKKLNTADRVNSTAKRILGRVLTSTLAQPLGADVAARTWFSFMLAAPFLGLTTRGGTGIHLELMRRLRAAQRYLWTLPRYRDLSPVELGDALLWDPADDPTPHGTAWVQPTDPDAKLGDRHRGARPGETAASMHLAGLAIDLAFRANPWVGSLSFKEVAGRAATLVGGTVTSASGARTRAAAAFGELSDAPGLGRKALHTLAQGTLTTGEIYDQLGQWNTWLEQYLALGSSDADLQTAIDARRADGTPGVVRAGDPPAKTLADWRKRIRKDIESLRANSFSAAGTPRDPGKGFLSLRRDLVIALRDHGCLAWGGVDLGQSDRGSGDMMHFDCRLDGIGRAFAGAAGGHVPTHHPCAGTASPQTEAEAGPAEEHQVPPTPKTKAVTLASHLTATKGELFQVNVKLRPDPPGWAPTLTTAIFVPATVKKTGPITVLLWIHGDLGVCEDGWTALSHVQSKTIAVVQMLADSKRPFVLIAPNMGWSANQGSHSLDRPKTMNAFLDDVAASLVGAGWASAPAIDRLILAGHSHFYALFYGLADTADDPQSSLGPLGKLTDVWGLDATYGKSDPNKYADKLTVWAAIRRTVQFSFLHTPGTDTSKVAERLEAKAKAAKISMEVKSIPPDKDPDTSDHCLMPQRQLGALLAAAK